MLENKKRDVVTRLYEPSIDLNRSAFELSKEHQKILKILRVKNKEKIALFDGQGLCVITVLNGKVLDLLEIEKKQKSQFSLTVCVSTSAFDSLKEIVQKSTEIGVDKIIFFKSEYSAFSLDDAKLNKLQVISVEALRQSENNFLPKIIKVDRLSDLDETCEHKIFFNEDEMKINWFEALIHQPISSMVLCFGPEGGWSDNDIQSLKSRGYVSMSLGPNILRLSTAVVLGLGLAKMKLIGGKK